MQPADPSPEERISAGHISFNFMVQVMMSRFDTYSIADTMYDPVPNLRNCSKAGGDGHGEEEMMAVEKDSEIE